MTTTERIANAIKHIIEEDRRADRERIAELERDAAHARTAQHAAVVERDRLKLFVDDLNAKLDEAHKENARLVLENSLGRTIQAAIAAPVVEEQGPWVVVTRKVDGGLHYYTSQQSDDWNNWATNPGTAMHFVNKVTADTFAAKTTKDYASTWFVLTLAKAKAGAPFDEPHAVFDGERLPWAARK